MFQFTNVGNHLPNNPLQKNNKISVFSGKPIKGMIYPLKESGLFLQMEEA